MSGTRVFIGRLTYKARESDVERFFKGFGRIRDISLKNGYGFVEFEDPRDADDAVYELNNREILGERVTVEHAKGVPRSGGGGIRSHRSDYGRSDRYERSSHYKSSSRDERGRINYYESRAISKYGPPVRTKYRVIVENLSTRVSWQDLKDYLREAGEVTYADAHKHRQNEGVVDFASYDDMKRAIEKMDNTEINGRRIHLIEDKSFRTPSRSRSGSRSHSRSRSRSRSRSGRRSRSRSPRRSGSRSRSRSPRSRSVSRGSRGRSRSRDRSRSGSARRSRSPRNRSRSRSMSGRSRSRERSRSRASEENGRRSQSKSPSGDAAQPEAHPATENQASPQKCDEEQNQQEEEKQEEMQRSRSPSVSRSRSPTPNKE